MAPDGEDPGSADAWVAERELERGRRWRRFVDAFLAQVPEIRESLAATIDPETPALFTPADLWIQVVIELLDRDDYPKYLDTDVWPRVLAFLEVSLELAALLEAELGEFHDDAEEVRGFAREGILCDVTGNPHGLRELLPFMGTRTAGAARWEVEYHVGSRGWGSDAVDWSAAGSRFVALTGVEAGQLRPVDALE